MKHLLSLVLCLLLLTGCFVGPASADTNPVPEASRAVVAIYSGIGYQNGSPYVLNGEYYGSGTGFGISPTGKDAQYFATNCHVVSDEVNGTYKPYKYVYIFIDGADIMDESTVIRAEVIYADTNVDLAIIKASSPISGVTTLPIVSAENLPLGEKVYAIGFPGIADALADEQHFTTSEMTATEGILSRHLTIGGVKCIAQTADVNHGNSGGPLIDGKGQVIGINTMIYTDSDTADRRCYAIYSDYITKAMDQVGIPYRSGGESISPVLVIGGIVIAAILVAAVILLLMRFKVAKQPMAPIITVRALCGPLQGQSWQLHSELSIGRDPSQSILFPQDTKGISRSHCIIRREGKNAFVTDLNSTYGTLLNGRQLPPNQPTPVEANSVISLASDKIQFIVTFE